MITDTPTPTETLTPSATPTATSTPTPTPDYYIEVTTRAGNDARIVRETSVADQWVILLLLAILVSMWLMYIANRLKGGK